MGLKDNFRQAARELLGVDAAEGQEDKVETAEHPAGEVSRADFSGMAGAYEEPDMVDPDGDIIPLTPGLAAPRRKTVVAEGTVVRGNMEAKGGVEVYGEVEGDLTSEEDLLVSGKLIGAGVSRSLEMRGGRMRGDVTVASTARLDEESILLGDVRADALYLQGKVKGDLTISGTVELEAHAIVLGNITARGLSVMEGAVLQGEVRISSQGIDDAFGDGTI